MTTGVEPEAPQVGARVELHSTTSKVAGMVAGTIVTIDEYWPAVRRWRVMVIDPRLGTVRRAFIRGMNKGGPPWKELRD